MTERTVQVLSQDGTEIKYQFQLDQAGDVVTMLISAANKANSRLGLLDGADNYMSQVLRAQAEMIAQGLHIRGLNAPDMMLDIRDFHQKFGLEYTGKPRILDPELFNFRDRFINEEFEEWKDEQPGLIEALTGDDGSPDHRRIALGLHQQLDALCDLMYVALGTAYLQFGPDVFHEAWRRVQAANMAKVRCENADDSKRGSTFDVIKPRGWTPPDHHDLVKDHAHSVYRHQAEEPELNGANQ
jgi:predicted HAD superfamily Cof-like phosphohydrolase